MRATLDHYAKKDPRVAIVDIDERSLREQGHWPWPRMKVAALVDRLGQAGAAVIGMDMVFAEPEANPVEQVAEALKGMKDQDPGVPAGRQSDAMVDQLRGLAEHLNGDRILAESLAANPVVLGYFLTPRSCGLRGFTPISESLPPNELSC
jgi:adenylate cyclase